MIYVGMCKEEWDMKTEQEKGLLKEKFKEFATAPLEKVDINNRILLDVIEKQANDIKVIKIITLIYFIASIIIAIAWFILV